MCNFITLKIKKKKFLMEYKRNLIFKKPLSSLLTTVYNLPNNNLI